VIVTCARCGHDWDEGDPGVRYASGDFWCNWESECDDRMAPQLPEDAPHPMDPLFEEWEAGQLAEATTAAEGASITAAWRARIAGDPNPERLQGVHDGQ
jgi:hypothetical protein